MNTIKWNNQEEWLSIRRRGIGGSDVAAILGISPWRNAIDVWLEKTGTLQGDSEKTLAMKLGSFLEDFVAEEYQTETGNYTARFNTTIQDGIFIGNLDRLIVQKGRTKAAVKGTILTNAFLECKTSSADVWPEVPLYYQTQVQHYLALYDGFEYADLACLFMKPHGGKEFKVYRVEKDLKTIEKLREYLSDWWARHILNGEPPQAKTESDAKRLWARSKGTSIECTPEIQECVEALQALKEEKKEREKKEQEYRDKICAFMGENEALQDADGKTLLTWKSSKDRQTLDVKGMLNSLREKYGEEEIRTYEIQHSKTTPGSRTMLIK